MPTFHSVSATSEGPILMRETCVQHLLAARGPAHIAGFVVPVVVDAVKCQMWLRPFSDVCEKIDKAVTPSVAHPNAAGTIVSIISMARIVTTLIDGSPQDVLRTGAHAVRPFCCLTAARGREATAQIADKDFLLSTTTASTQQVALRRDSGRMFAAAHNTSPWSLRDDCPITNDSS